MKNGKLKPRKRVPAVVNGWFVYIVECVNQSFYTGITNNLVRRVATHNAGKGAAYTRMWGPVHLLWSEPHPDRSSATKREAEIKRWPRKRKASLISAPTSLSC